MTPVLEVKNLKTYFRTPFGLGKAVDGISFSIGKGETFALVGESGCGKSVTALSIMQLVPGPHGFIAEGECFLNGKEITGLSESEKRKIRGNNISMIFQEPMTSLNPVFTIGEQIVEAVKLHHKKSSREARDIAVGMLGKVRLKSPETLFKEYPHRLSGGMRQRVMIAMALACKPDLLIADEPTTSLDVTIQREILNLIKELQTEMFASVLLISHNLAVVFENANRVGVMYGGKIVEMSGTKDIFRNPMHPYTIKLLRAAPGVEKRTKPLDTIPGAVPASVDFPAGCRFSGRCHREMEGCAAMEPPLYGRENSHLVTHLVTHLAAHLVACHLYDPGFMSKPYSRPLGKIPEAAPLPALPHKDRETLLTVKGLKYYYPVKKGILKKTTGYLRAVDGIDLTVRKGSTLALVGESGCGKTTAGKAILKLIEPTEGNVIFKGCDITRLSGRGLLPYRSLMQIIFQDPYSSLDPRMMAGDIIEEGLKSLKPGLGKKSRKERVSRVLDMVGLTPDMRNRYPHEFSGGQRQRIGIARVLAVEPEFIVCDEATSSLDVSVQAQILNLLKSIQQDFGLSFLFITHDLSIVEYMADEVAVMYDGKIVESGTVEEIFTNPKEEYTKRLLLAVPRIEVA
ncbi:MAG: ABC transporter ATP-binding protein [Deltaproteobacteria bacterium]|nr:ABC transporter ATP-binding protein [Deltaproteobacteria bacterium]